MNIEQLKKLDDDHQQWLEKQLSEYSWEDYDGFGAAFAACLTTGRRVT